MKSLDGLIQHLLEEIALCGDYGAGTSDFIRYVNDYYHPKPESQGGPPTNSGTTSVVDRRFLEKIWEWLTRHPDIEIGESGWANQFSLSEVEHRNHIGTKQPDRPINDASSTPQQQRESLAPSTTLKGSRASVSRSSRNLKDSSLDHAPVAVRMYAGIERRWQAITGHAPDRTRVPRLDFACLSIIAAHREQGLLQPQLVTISGQDKRSVPERTKRLHEAGYISKVPVFLNKCHTSRLTLKRYVKESVQGNDLSRAVDDTERDIPPAHTSSRYPVDFLALQRKIFDILREVKLVTFNELKAKLGFTASPWYNRLFARHMRRLERIGCIKQVRARPQIETATPFLFRCIKFVREPQGKEWMPFQSPSRHQSKLTGAEDTETAVMFNDEQDYQAEEARFLAGHGGSQDSHQLEEVERPVPQWSGDENISNLLFNLVHASGPIGMSTTDIKNRSMGSFNLRPTENHLSRLAEMWQMSQPLHLRHLCIIRDAALTNRVPHYVHYSFENFQKLVDDGKASWDSVMTITKEHKDFKNIAAIEAKPELDDNGFPQLSSSLFYGPNYHATLVDCSRGIDISPLPRSTIDPKVVKSKDGIRSKSRIDRTAVRNQSKDSTSHTQKVLQMQNRRPRKLRGGEPNLLVTNAGRPRKRPRADRPLDLDRTSHPEQKKLSGSQMAAIRYKKLKIVTEIEKQVVRGGDHYQTTAATLKLAIEQYQNAEREPPWDILEEIRLGALGPCLLALHYSKNVGILNGAVRDQQGTLRVSDFKPSATAHSLPLGATELQIIEDIMRSRIQLLELIPIHDKFKKNNSDVLLEAIHQSAQATRAVRQPFQKLPLGKQPGARGKSKHKIMKNQESNIPVNVSQATTGSETHKSGDFPPQTTPTSGPSRTLTDIPRRVSVCSGGELAVCSGGELDHNLPSIAAHTSPVLAEESTTEKTEASKGKYNLAGPVQNQRKYNRKKTSIANSNSTPVSAEPETPHRILGGLLPYTQGVTHQYLPSVAAHSWPVTLGTLVIENPVTLKRKLVSVQPRQNKRAKKASWKKVQLDLRPDVVAPTPSPRSSQRLEMQTYEQQANSVTRPNVGCFVGKAVSLYQPGKRGARRKSRLAIFKSPLIQGFPCLSASSGMITPVIQVQQQAPAVPNRPNEPNEHQTDAMHADIPAPDGPPADISPASVTQYITPAAIANFTVNPVQRRPGDGSSDQRHLISPEQSNAMPVPSRPSTVVHPLPDITYTGEHILGTKRKRTTSDDGRREVVRPRRAIGASNHIIASKLDNLRSAVDQGEMIEADQSASFITGICDPSSGQAVHRLASGESSPAPQDEVEASVQAAAHLQDSQIQAVQPEVKQAQDNRGFDPGVIAQSGIPSGPSHHSVETATRSSGAETIQQEHAFVVSIPKAQATVGTASPTPLHDQNKDSTERDIPLEQDPLPETLEDTTFMHGLGAGPSTTRPDIISGASSPRLPDGGNNNEAPESEAPAKCFQDTHVAVAQTPTSQIVANDSTGPKGRKGVQRMRPQGGSIAAQRRTIVMDIVRRCGGVYPGVPELGVPFKEQWSKSGYPGKAETATLKGVVDYLCEINQLRRILFVFKDTRGVHVHKYMITTTEISTTDPRVFALQDRIKNLHPSWYFPEDLGSLDEVRSTYRNTDGPLKNRTVKDLELDEGRVSLQQKPTYIERYEFKEKIRQEKLAEEDRQVAKIRAILAQGKFPDGRGVFGQSTIDSLNGADNRRYLLSIAKKHKVHRLASIKNRANNTGDLGRAGRESSHDLTQDTTTGIASGQPGEMHRAALPQSEDSLTFTRMLGIENFESGLKSQTVEDEEHERAIQRIVASYAAEGIILGPYLPPTAPPESRMFRLGSNQLHPLPDLESEVREAKRRRKSFAFELHSKAARQQMYTVMEPEHVFHPATGTFSVNFSPFRTINQIRGIYHWQPPPQKDFYELVDDSQRWELRTKGLQDAKFEDWIFVNYKFPHRHQTRFVPSRSTAQSRRSKGRELQDYNQAPEQILKNMTPDEQILADLAAVQPRTAPGSNHSSRESTSSAAAVATSSASIPPSSIIPAKRKDVTPHERFKTRRLTTSDKWPPSLRSNSSRDAVGGAEANRRHRKSFDVRRGEKASPDFTQRILTAVIVIRTLTGGIERNIDWLLVAKVFGTEYTPLYLSKMWPKALQAHKVQAEMIREGFQQLFLKAYEEGLVPPLDYDKLEDYDWPWLVEWTVERLDTPIDGALDLPLQRDKIDQAFSFDVGEELDMSLYYEFCAGSAKIHRRESELHKKAWVQPLIRQRGERSVVSPNKLEVVKTWIRANFATSGKVYQARSAADRLRQFDERSRKQALNEMHREGVFMHQNKGRSMPGRQYALSQKYLKPLKKKIEVSHLQQAAMFKREIDETLANDREMIIPQLAGDAFTLAVQNMQAHRRVSFVAKNPPVEKFGVGGFGNYKGRQIPMSKYHFDVGLQATDRYREGNPLLPLPKPPCVPSSDADREKIPLWYDIHSDVIKDLWEMCVAAVMSILITRPGVSMHEVEPSVRPALGLWEVQMLLDWMVEAKAARKMGRSYAAEEWWWLCLDSGKTFEEEAKSEEEEKVGRREELRNGKEMTAESGEEERGGQRWDQDDGSIETLDELLGAWHEA
ncbi:MAG: hypothetical protein LQ348_001630 [Seirophora lacunosa]|nr:MAG: hypothetical protein LQ348_001630 [Seirophora lacunosa]